MKKKRNIECAKRKSIDFFKYAEKTYLNISLIEESYCSGGNK